MARGNRQGRALKLLALLAAALLGLLVVAWVGLVLWSRSPGFEAMLEARANAASPCQVDLDGVGLTWFGNLYAANLRVVDPAGGPFLATGPVEVSWRWPFGEAAPLRVDLGGGHLEVEAETWRRARREGRLRPGGGAPPTPVAPGTRSGRPRLAAQGTLEVAARDLVDLRVGPLEGRARDPRFGVDWRLDAVGLDATVASDQSLEVREITLGLREVTTLRAEGRLNRAGGTIEVELPPTDLGKLAAVPPFGVPLLGLGMGISGNLSTRWSLEVAEQRVSAAQGEVEVRALTLSAGEERLVGPVTGAWTAELGDGGQVRGPLDLEQVAVTVSGFPLTIEGGKGTLSIGPRGARVSRLAGRMPFGPARMAWDLSWAGGLNWTCALEVGSPDHWLGAGVLEARPAGLRARGLHLKGPGLDLEVGGGLLPEGFQPPTWRAAQVEAHGRVQGHALRLQDLGGLLYLDSEGGYSFDFSGAGGVLRGQVTTAGGLRVWAQSPGSTMRAVEVGAP